MSLNRAAGSFGEDEVCYAIAGDVSKGDFLYVVFFCFLGCGGIVGCWGWVSCGYWVFGNCWIMVGVKKARGAGFGWRSVLNIMGKVELVCYGAV